MKPLTIEQLKALEVGDWVWVCGTRYGNQYACICRQNFEKNYLNLTLTFGLNERFSYNDYGTKWLAYKNKEQAEAKGEIVEFGTPFFSKHFNTWCVFERVDDYIQTVCIAEEQAKARLKELQSK